MDILTKHNDINQVGPEQSDHPVLKTRFATHFYRRNLCIFKRMSPNSVPIFRWPTAHFGLGNVLHWTGDKPLNEPIMTTVAQPKLV